MKENTDKPPVQANADAPCCGPAANVNLTCRPVPVAARIETACGPVDAVASAWSWKDRLGAAGVRLGINRMDYAVKPGLYAIGLPGKASPVLVSANYKLSFDVLRAALAGIDAWLLVIDTKGVNVWCAAGKGTFGTMEIARRVMMTGLEKIVDTRTLIVPQLGAPGVSAHMVQAFCGFSVVYGPVRASDIKAYLASGMQVTPEMRRVLFTLGDRLAVSWLELAAVFRPALAVSLLLAVLPFVTAGRAFHVPGAQAAALALIGWGAILSGTVLTAAFLPFIPLRPFAAKGGLLGAAVTAGILLAVGWAWPLTTWLSLMLGTAALSGFLALNFTGSSTFTSLSGVKKEIKYAVPACIGLFAAAVLVYVVGRIV